MHRFLLSKTTAILNKPGSCFLFLMLLTPQIIFAQIDSALSYREALHIKNKLLVTNLRLTEVVSKKKTIPAKVRKFSNLEKLSLRPMARAFARPVGGGPCMIRYVDSRLNELPDWISELPKLHTLDLIGVSNIDFVVEMKKLLQLNSLKTLSIDPDTCNDLLIDILVQFQRLQTLKIRAEVSAAQFERLQKALPNATITTGIYADY